MTKRNTTETSAQWRRRIMRETEGMTKPGDILAHLAKDTRANGTPPPDEENSR